MSDELRVASGCDPHARGGVTYRIGAWVGDGEPIALSDESRIWGGFVCIADEAFSRDPVPIFADGNSQKDLRGLVGLLKKRKYAFGESDRVSTLSVAAMTYHGKIDFGGVEPIFARVILYVPHSIQGVTFDAVQFISQFRKYMQETG